jgi:putative heme-binding domain-containing protein
MALAGADDPFLAASTDRERLRDFLEAVPLVAESARGSLYSKVAPLAETLPSHIGDESQAGQSLGGGIQVEYYYPSANNVALETLDGMEPKAVGIVPEITMEVPQLQQRDQFALRCTGKLSVSRAGRYVFFIASDDGSRVYLDGQLLIDNDGLHGMVEKRGAVELTAGPHDLVVTYFDNGGGDGLSVQWRGPGFGKQNIPASVLSVGGGETLNDVAIRVLATIPGHDAEKFTAMAALVAKGRNRSAAISTLRSVPAEAWDSNQVPPLIDNLIGYLSSMPARNRTSGTALEAVELAKTLAGRLSADARKSVEEQLQNLDVRVIAIGTVPHRMIFDKELIVVEAGKPVEFRFANVDAMPHNFAVVVPGALQEVGELAEATGRDADAVARHYIPRSDKVLLSSRLLQTGESETLAFEVPKEPGVYPYVCTYPGHWRRMYGALYVVEDLESFQRDEQAYLAVNPLEIRDELLKLNTRSHEWTYDELVEEIRELPGGRSYEVGKELFKVASCAGCHQLGGVGTVFGPDLAKLDAKRHVTTIMLQSILEPSKEIEEKYQPYIFALQDGKVITGMIVEETAEEFHVIIDPLAKADPTVIRKEEVEERSKSTVSLMPQGLLNKLSREEILDLLAFVYAGGDEKHALFGEHHDHHH